MPDPAAAGPSPPQPPPRLREEGELSSGADDDEALHTHLIAPSNVGKSVEALQVSPATFYGKSSTSLSVANARPNKSIAPSYRNALRPKQVQFKVTTNRNLCWQKTASNDNLVISFDDDDDSGSDSGKSKQERNRGRGGSEDMCKMANGMQPKFLREETPQQMAQIAKLGSTTCSTVSSTFRNSGASRGPGSGTFMPRREPPVRQITPPKMSSSQKDGNGVGVNSADRLENLRHEIAVRESELKVQKRALTLGCEKTADLCTAQSRLPMEKPSFEESNGGGCSPLNGPLGSDGRPMKRLKLVQQCSTDQVIRGRLEVPGPSDNSTWKNNMHSADRRSCFENGSAMNHNASEMGHFVTTDPSNQRQHNGATENLRSWKTRHRVTQDTDKHAAVEYSNKLAAVEYTGKQSMSEDTRTLVPVTSVHAGASAAKTPMQVKDGMFSVCCWEHVMPVDASTLSKQQSHLQSGMQNTDLLNSNGHIGTGHGNSTLLSLLELEELEEKELEEAQEHRRRCEVEEREALKAYRKAQRAFIEANERCAILRRKRELLSAQLHGCIAENSSSVLPSSAWNPGDTHVMPSAFNCQIPTDCQMQENLGGNSNRPCPDEAAHEPNGRHELQSDDHCGEPAASTADPKFVSLVNDICGPVNLSNEPSDYMEDNLPFPASHARSECPSHLENGIEETTHADVHDNGQTSGDCALDYELLEASLRSRLVERFGKKTPSKNSGECTAEFAIGKEADGEHNKLSASLGPQFQEAEGNFLTNSEGMTGLESDDADLAVEIGGQSNCTNGPSMDNYDGTTDPEDNISSIRESCSQLCVNYLILPSSAPQNAARHIKRILAGFCKEALGYKNECLTSDAISEAAISVPDRIQDHTEENNRMLSGTNPKDNGVLGCGIDPFWPFCMFELRGRCNDEECQWQHVQPYDWRKPKQTKQAISSISGKIPCGLFQHILPVPTYRIGSNLIRADLNLVQSVLACSIWQYWQRGFCASFPLPLSVQRVLPSDAPFLQTGDGSIADFNRNRQLLYFRSLGSRKGSVDIEQFLEMALDLYSAKVNKTDRLKALLLLARAIEDDPSTVILWVFYLHVYYQKDEGLGKDDMFSHAVQHNVCSYELWLLYINSRLRFGDRLDAYNDALSMLCQMTANTDEELKDRSAFVLDIFLQMIYFLCMSGNVEKAVSRIYGIMPTTPPDYSGDKLLTDVLSCLTMSDKCIFWVSCIYVSIYRKLPEEIIDQLELQKDLSHEFSWPTIELRVVNRGQAIELLKYAVDKMVLDINESIKNGDPSHLRFTCFLAVSHINCLAALEGFQSSADLLVNYMKKYPTCAEILLISARLDGKCNTFPGLRGFDELLSNWPKEVGGIQFLWNQYAEHALSNNTELAEKLLTRWFEEYGKDSNLQCIAAIGGDAASKDESCCPSEGLLLASSKELGSGTSTTEDRVFWFLNLSLYKMLQNNLQEALLAVDEALRLARGKSYEHCLREHAAIHILDKSSPSTDFRSIFNLISGYLADHHTVPMRELLSRRYCRNVKRHRVRQLINDIIGPASSDPLLINSILEVCYGPSLLPDKIDKVKDFVDFVESVMEVLPANYRLALSVGRVVVRHFSGADPTSKGTRFWASSILVNAIFRAVPVASEAVWLEGADLLEKLQAAEIVKRFYQQATSVYPFSFKLWHTYMNACKKSGSNTQSIVEAVRQRGIELNLTLS